MIAHSLRHGTDVERFKADTCIWLITLKAEWYIPHDSFTFILIPTPLEDKEASYEVNGQTYRALGTLPYERLKALEKQGLKPCLDLDYGLEDDDNDED